MPKLSLFLHILLSITILFMSMACTERAPTNVESGTAKQILHIGNSDEPRELDPHLSTGSVESNIHNALSEGLTARHPETLEIVPALAESWTVNNEKTRYTFTLRANAKWSNGEPITADQIAWSWQRSLMPALGSEWAYMKYYIDGAEAFHTGTTTDFNNVGIKALDSQTLEVRLISPVDYFLQLLAHSSYFPVHPPTILAHGRIDQAISKWTRPENWVGNGPFTLQSWAINEHIHVEKNPFYWDSTNVRLNALYFYPITDQQAEVRAFRSGQIHLSYSPTMAIEKVAYYKKNQPDVLRITPTYATYYYEFNTTKKPYNDARVRQALAMAIDRKTLVEHVSKAGEKPAYSLIPDAPQRYSPAKLFDYAPDKARTLLSEAGYPNGEGFPKTEILYNSQDNHRKIALAIQQMLRDNLNIDVQLVNQEWKVYLNSKRNLEHDIARAGWIADYLDPSNFLEILSSSSGNNDTGWHHDAYDKAIAELKITTDSDKRKQLFDDANRILATEMPIIPIYLYSDVNLVSTDVQGWYDNILHHHPYKGVYLQKTLTP